MVKCSNIRYVVMLLIIAVSVLSAYAQESENNREKESMWSGRINFDPINTGFTKGTSSFSAGMTFYHNLYKDLALGLGFQLQENWEFAKAPNIPLYLSLHFDKQTSKISPIIDVETGFSINPSTLSHPSYFLNPMVGIRYNDWGIGIGYTGSIAMGYEKAVWGSNLNIRLAYYISNSRGKNNYSRLVNYLNQSNLYISLGYEIASTDKDFFASDLYEVNMSTVGVNLAWLLPICKNFEMGPALGINLGVGSVDFIYVPLALRSRYNFKQANFAKNFYPWLQLDLGGAFREGGDYDVKSGLVRPAAGISMDVRGGKSSVELGVSYSSIKVRPYQTEDKKHSINNVGIYLGYRF